MAARARKGSESRRYSRVKTAFKNASDAEIAKKLDISGQAISQWKSGTTVPSDAKMIRVAEATRVPLEWLLTEGASPLDLTEVGELPGADREFETSEIAALFYQYKELSPEDQEQLRAVFEMVREEIKRRGLKKGTG